jgi:NADPH:quinone reductase-like Zn-dependent oxidoreductase
VHVAELVSTHRLADNGLTPDGGVNSTAIQIAKLAGATVYALASTVCRMEKAQELSADFVVDYREDHDWSKTVRNLTGGRGVVVDNVGWDALVQRMRAAAPRGRIVMVGKTSDAGGEIEIDVICAIQLSIIGSLMGSHQDFVDVLDLLEADLRLADAPLRRKLCLWTP